MAEIILSAFSDEYSSDFDAQIEALRMHGIPLMEIRGVSGKNIAAITPEEAKEVSAKLRDAGIGLSAIGSPIGKIRIEDPMAPHIEQLKRLLDVTHILGADRIRMFSFYMPAGCGDVSPYRNEVIDRLGQMIEIAESEEVLLCHENEKGIYGDVPERCLEIDRAFGGRLGCVFDPANYAQCGVKVYPHAYEMLSASITYLHIKDCDAMLETCVPGTGIGCIEELLSAASKLPKEKLVVTLEPHLWEFSGLKGLENGEKTMITQKFDSAEAAFAAGVEGLKRCIESIH